MGDYKKDSEQDKSMGCLIQEIDGYSDEELLKEFEAVERMTVPLPIPAPPPDEFEKIWARIQEERAESKDSSESNEPEHPKIIRPRFRWKKFAAVGLIACLVAGSGCMVAMGTKSYFYREKELGNGQGKVFVNDSYKADINGEEDAYSKIEQELGIVPFKLGYVPSDMSFDGLYIQNGIAKMVFTYCGKHFYVTQSKSYKEASYYYDSIKDYMDIIYNKWIDENIKITKENLDNGECRLEAIFVSKGVYCRVVGTMEKEEFEIVISRVIN